MDSRHSSGYADWTSRVLSITSLIIVGIVVYAVFFVEREPETPNAELLVSQFSEKLDSVEAKAAQRLAEYEQRQEQLQADYQATLDRHSQQMQQWDDQLIDALDEFQRDAKQKLAAIQRDARWNPSDFRVESDAVVNGNTRDRGGEEPNATEDALTDNASDPFPQLPTVGPNDLALDGPGNVNSSQRASTEPSDETLGQTENGSASNRGSLQLIDATFSDETGAERQNTVLVRIRNTGEEPAAIERIRFQPLADYQVPDQESLKLDSTDTEIVTVAYDPSDNTSKKAGQHGIYDRSLSQPLAIPAGESISLRLIIDDTTHRGWGFKGKAILFYGDDQSTLLVPSIRVNFQPST